MKVLEIKKSYEKCAEAGWFGYDFILDAPVDAELIKHLGSLGNLIFLSALTKPFFKVENHNLIVKGICGEKEIRVAINSPSEERKLNEIEQSINRFFNVPHASD